MYHVFLAFLEKRIRCIFLSAASEIDTQDARDRMYSQFGSALDYLPYTIRFTSIEIGYKI
jgi:hypothetical protein